jgi:hypothetical protein
MKLSSSALELMPYIETIFQMPTSLCQIISMQPNSFDLLIQRVEFVFLLVKPKVLVCATSMELAEFALPSILTKLYSVGLLISILMSQK